ncbi:MAG: hypothetical protein V3U37_05615 [Nitrospinaceae bacterium]
MTLRPKNLKLPLALLIIAGICLSGPRFISDLAGSWLGLAHAQVKMLDKQRADQKKLDAAKKAAERAKKVREREERKEEGIPGEVSEEEAVAPQEVKLPQQAPAISPETFRMIEMIERKNTELKKREEELRVKEQQLNALERKISQDIQKIEDALARSQEQIGLQKDLIQENVDSLIKVYSSMKPAEAATLLEAINEDLALQIISGMKSKIAGQVLSQLDVKVAKNISEKLAGKKTESP